MSYLVLARKYRPQTFSDVIGQEAVTRTIKNSILSGRIANAYIFCGPRGVGKTSVARLMAKTLNCAAPTENGPCNKCDSCVEITRSGNIDVLEIDGASNRGIDEIRTLRENVKFSPSKGKYKIYIIDEVHMLTTEAFNALLKTLEEPPVHVRFLFATTEAHKVLATIMSRCQRFDFKRISPGMIHDRVIDVAKKEKIKISEKAALLIARAGDGSLRDALVVLDQMISFSTGEILPDDVVELLGMVQKDRLFELSEALIASDAGRVARTVDDLINEGKDPVFIANSLIGYYRDLMILKTAGAPTADMVFDKNEMARMREQLESLSLEEILYILQNLSHCLTLMKSTVFARAPLEIALIRMTRRASVLSLRDVLDKMDNASFVEAPAAASIVSPAATKNTAGKSVVDEEVWDGGESNSEGNATEASAGDFEKVQAHWRAVLTYVKNKKMSTHTFLAAARPVEISGDKVVIGFDRNHTFNKEALETGDNKALVEEAVRKVTGAEPIIEFALLDFLGGEEADSREKAVRKDIAKETMKPVIEKAMDVFGGHVVKDIMEDTV